MNLRLRLDFLYQVSLQNKQLNKVTTKICISKKLRGALCFSTISDSKVSRNKNKDYQMIIQVCLFISSENLHDSSFFNIYFEI
ncbi:hypothetical protein pb186bvf_020126 [Paramecium bursaria]